MSDPGAQSAVVCEFSQTSGTGTYSLARNIPGSLRFAAFFSDGDEIDYCATNGAYIEAGTGTFDATANTLSRDVITASSTGYAIDWPAGGQVFIRPLARRPYQIGFSFVGGVLANSQRLGDHVFSVAAKIPADFGAYAGHASEASGSANATSNTAIKVQKNGSDVGTITIGSGGVSPTFSTSGVTVSFAAGDKLTLVGPSTADATFANFCCTLVLYEA
jgi:hypothetical protein